MSRQHYVSIDIGSKNTAVVLASKDRIKQAEVFHINAEQIKEKQNINRRINRIRERGYNRIQQKSYILEKQIHSYFENIKDKAKLDYKDINILTRFFSSTSWIKHKGFTYDKDKINLVYYYHKDKPQSSFEVKLPIFDICVKLKEIKNDLIPKGEIEKLANTISKVLEKGDSQHIKEKLQNEIEALCSVDEELTPELNLKVYDHLQELSEVQTIENFLYEKIDDIQKILQGIKQAFYDENGEKIAQGYIEVVKNAVQKQKDSQNQDVVFNKSTLIELLKNSKDNKTIYGSLREEFDARIIEGYQILKEYDIRDLKKTLRNHLDFLLDDKPYSEGFLKNLYEEISDFILNIMMSEHLRDVNLIIAENKDGDKKSLKAIKAFNWKNHFIAFFQDSKPRQKYLYEIGRDFRCLDSFAMGNREDGDEKGKMVSLGRRIIRDFAVDPTIMNIMQGDSYYLKYLIKKIKQDENIGESEQKKEIKKQKKEVVNENIAQIKKCLDKILKINRASITNDLYRIVTNTANLEGKVLSKLRRLFANEEQNRSDIHKLICNYYINKSYNNCPSRREYLKNIFTEKHYKDENLISQDEEYVRSYKKEVPLYKLFITIDPKNTIPPYLNIKNKNVPLCNNMYINEDFLYALFGVQDIKTIISEIKKHYFSEDSSLVLNKRYENPTEKGNKENILNRKSDTAYLMYFFNITKSTASKILNIETVENIHHDEFIKKLIKRISLTKKQEDILEEIYNRYYKERKISESGGYICYSEMIYKAVQCIIKRQRIAIRNSKTDRKGNKKVPFKKENDEIKEEILQTLEYYVNASDSYGKLYPLKTEIKQDFVERVYPQIEKTLYSNYKDPEYAKISFDMHESIIKNTSKYLDFFVQCNHKTTTKNKDFIVRSIANVLRIVGDGQTNKESIKVIEKLFYGEQNNNKKQNALNNSLVKKIDDFLEEYNANKSEEFIENKGKIKLITEFKKFQTANNIMFSIIAAMEKNDKYAMGSFAYILKQVSDLCKNPKGFARECAICNDIKNQINEQFEDRGQSGVNFIRIPKQTTRTVVKGKIKEYIQQLSARINYMCGKEDIADVLLSVEENSFDTTGYNDSLTVESKKEEFIEFYKNKKGICLYCGKENKAEWNWDHIISKNEYPTTFNCQENLVAVCRKCNENKGDKRIVEFIKDNGVIIRKNLHYLDVSSRREDFLKGEKHLIKEIIDKYKSCKMSKNSTVFGQLKNSILELKLQEKAKGDIKIASFGLKSNRKTVLGDQAKNIVRCIIRESLFYFDVLGDENKKEVIEYFEDNSRISSVNGIQKLLIYRLQERLLIHNAPNNKGNKLIRISSGNATDSVTENKKEANLSDRIYIKSGRVSEVRKKIKESLERQQEAGDRCEFKEFILESINSKYSTKDKKNSSASGEKSAENMEKAEDSSNKQQDIFSHIIDAFIVNKIAVANEKKQYDQNIVENTINMLISFLANKKEEMPHILNCFTTDYDYKNIVKKHTSKTMLTENIYSPSNRQSKKEVFQREFLKSLKNEKGKIDETIKQYKDIIENYSSNNLLKGKSWYELKVSQSEYVSDKLKDSIKSIAKTEDQDIKNDFGKIRYVQRNSSSEKKSKKKSHNHGQMFRTIRILDIIIKNIDSAYDDFKINGKVEIPTVDKEQYELLKSIFERIQKTDDEKKYLDLLKKMLLNKNLDTNIKLFDEGVKKNIEELTNLATKGGAKGTECFVHKSNRYKDECSAIWVSLDGKNGSRKKLFNGFCPFTGELIRKSLREDLVSNFYIDSKTKGLDSIESDIIDAMNINYSEQYITFKEDTEKKYKIYKMYFDFSNDSNFKCRFFVGKKVINELKLDKEKQKDFAAKTKKVFRKTGNRISVDKRAKTHIQDYIELGYDNKSAKNDEDYAKIYRIAARTNLVQSKE